MSYLQAGRTFEPGLVLALWLWTYLEHLTCYFNTWNARSTALSEVSRSGLVWFDVEPLKGFHRFKEMRFTV